MKVHLKKNYRWGLWGGFCGRSIENIERVHLYIKGVTCKPCLKAYKKHIVKQL